MKKIIVFTLALHSVLLSAQTKTVKPVVSVKPVVAEANPKLEQDKASIKSLCGIYKVNFDFAETFSPDTAYKFHKSYHESGIEYVFLVDESDKKIELQHLLIINDSIIVKHWRQEWVYENTELYSYYKNDEWIRKDITAEQAKGTWTQKVFSVDDSPRYESYGSWLHVDGKNYWEGVTDAPLPRREYTKRSDYNVMRRHARMIINADGWTLEQDNEKILRNDGVDKLLCWEKGIEKFTKGNYDAVPAVKYWEKQKNYWADVRKVWADVYGTQKDLKIISKIDNKKLHEKLFELGIRSCKGTNYEQGAAAGEIKSVIEAYIKQS